MLIDVPYAGEYESLKEAMKAIEEYKPELEGVLPKDEYAARECKNFCVNGHFAGNCYYFLRRRNDCK